MLESLGAAGAKIQKSIDDFRAKHAAELRFLPSQRQPDTQRAGGSGSGQAGASGSSATHGRTTCVPVFRADEDIIDPERVWNPDDVLTVDELLSSKVCLASDFMRSAKLCGITVSSLLPVCVRRSLQDRWTLPELSKRPCHDPHHGREDNLACKRVRDHDPAAGRRALRLQRGHLLRETPRPAEHHDEWLGLPSWG